MTLWTVAHQASLSYTISQSLFKLLSIESVITSDHLILCLPLLFLPSIFPSIRVFSSELALHIRWPKFGCFSFSISPSNDIQILFPLGLPGLISLLSRDTQESSPMPIENINSLMLSLLYGPTPTSELHLLGYIIVFIFLPHKVIFTGSKG